MWMVKKEGQNNLLLPPIQGIRGPGRRFGEGTEGALPSASVASRSRPKGYAGPPEELEGLFPEKAQIVCLDRPVSDLPRPILEPALQGRPPLRRIEGPRMGLQGPEKLGERPRLLQDLAHRPHPLAQHQGIGILTLGKGGKSQGVPGLEQRKRAVDRASRCP